MLSYVRSFTSLLLAALYNDYADEDVPDVDEPDIDIPDAEPAEEQAAPPSPCSVSPPDEAAHEDSQSPSPSQSCPLPRKPARLGRRSPPPVNVYALGGWSRACCFDFNFGCCHRQHPCIVQDSAAVFMSVVRTEIERAPRAPAEGWGGVG